MARQVGAQVSSVFNDNNGTNENGIEVVSLLVSNHPGGSNNTTTQSIANLNGYQVAGLDATDGGQNLREGFAYFRGVPITSWPVNDRRRVIVINGASNSATHSQWEILYNQEFPTYSNMVSVINSVESGPAGLDFPTWQASFTFLDGDEGPTADPDRDGATNLLEFFSGTDPLDLTSKPVGEIQNQNGAITYRYQLAKDRIGISHRLQIGPLDSLADFTPEEIETTPIDDNLDQISITLPAGLKSFIRQVINIEP